MVYVVSLGWELSNAEWVLGRFWATHQSGSEHALKLKERLQRFLQTTHKTSSHWREQELNPSTLFRHLKLNPPKVHFRFFVLHNYWIVIFIQVYPSTLFSDNLNCNEIIFKKFV